MWSFKTLFDLLLSRKISEKCKKQILTKNNKYVVLLLLLSLDSRINLTMLGSLLFLLHVDEDSNPTFQYADINI